MPKLNFPLFVLLIATVQLQACLSSSVLGKSSAQHDMTIDGIDVQNYHLTIEPNFKSGTIHGHEKIRIRVNSSAKNILKFNGKGISILSAKLGDEAITITSLDTDRGTDLIVPLPKENVSDEIIDLEIQYKAKPERGFYSDENTIFTGYFACDWMICRQNAFGDKSTVTLEIKLPREMETLGPGQLKASKIMPDGSYRVNWHEAKPYSPYLYAFATGDFSISEQVMNGTTLRFVSPIADEVELKKLFAPTGEMLAFFETKAGVNIPQPIYSQLYIKGGYAQEAVSHSIIGSRMLNPILDTPQEDWVIAHELAHQWWGNAITCKDLSHFWLNEGLTVFMVAAWKQERWGQDAYTHEMSLAKRRYEHAKMANFDVPLSFDGEYPTRRVRSAIQYSKGALFFDAMRSELGDEIFWAGLKVYTQNNMGKTVVSSDLQDVFENSSGRDLSKLFDAWVY